jgi:hypothetical protein
MAGMLTCRLVSTRRARSRLRAVRAMASPVRAHDHAPPGYPGGA